MSEKFTRNIDLKEEPQQVKDLQVTRLDGSGEMSVHSFEPSRLHRAGEGDYRTTKAKFGSLAVTDANRPQREQKDARFTLNPLLRDPLSVEAEEQRVINERIEKTVKEVSEKARIESAKLGYSEGFESGKADAFRAFAKESVIRLEQLDTLVRQVETAKSEIYKANERFLIELVFQISKKVLLKEFQIDREYLSRLVNEAIDRIDLGEYLTIVIHPEDRELISQISAKISERLGSAKNFSIELSTKVDRGGCQVETEWGVVASSIESQLETIEKALLQKAGDSPQ